MGLGAGNIVTVSILGRQFGQRILNVLHYEVTGPATGASTATDLDNLIAEFAGVGFVPGNDRLTPFLACLPASYQVEAIRAQLIDPTRSAFVERPFTSLGTYATGAGACNRAASLVKRTALSGRPQIGRIQLGGIPDDGSANGVLTAGYKLVCDSFAAAISSDIVFTGVSLQFHLCLYHKGKVPNFDLVTSVTTQSTTRVMRRRTVGLGE